MQRSPSQQSLPPPNLQQFRGSLVELLGRVFAPGDFRFELRAWPSLSQLGLSLPNPPSLHNDFVELLCRAFAPRDFRFEPRAWLSLRRRGQMASWKKCNWHLFYTNISSRPLGSANGTSELEYANVLVFHERAYG